MSSDKEKLLGERAIVIGAGMRGLMAAGMLARFFAEVIVLDKDRLPTEAEPRMGVPQSVHSHALLVGGRRNIEQIFPGFLSEMVDSGAIVLRQGQEMNVRDWLGWWPKRDLGLSSIYMTRPLLEGTVRDGLSVSGWKHTDKEISVTVSRGQAAILKADFVVDATGYGPVEEVLIGIGQAYASALFEIPPDGKKHRIALLILALRRSAIRHFCLR